MSAETNKFQSIIIGIIMIAIALYLGGLLLPLALEAFGNFTSTNSNIETMMVEVLPIVGILAVVMLLLGVIIYSINKND